MLLYTLAPKPHQGLYENSWVTTVARLTTLPLAASTYSMPHLTV